ncbi:MAG: substrate-binding domain-containing protein [Oscillospiraceae bacterium]
MKRITGIVLALALTVAMLASCSTAGADNGGNTQGTEEFDHSHSINVLSREDGSGTRGAFIELFGIQQKDAQGKKIDNTTEDADITNSTAVMMTSVQGDEYSIGYISLGSLGDTVKPLKIDGEEASTENIKSGAYKISRPFNIATKDGLSDAAQDFINYIMSSDGQTVVEDSGYISVGNGEAYKSNGAKGKVVVAGSSSVTPVMEKLKEAFAKINAEIEIELQTSDSTTGMNSAIDGVCDIGMASRELQDSEIQKGLNATAIAIDGIAVIVNKECPFNGLSKDQVMQIFTGNITAWSELLQ